MKHLIAVGIWYVSRVAPRTGAWIETIKSSQKIRVLCVAPRTGAWIETKSG